MAENTAIEWATHTFNPWEGCQKVGPGCDHCYAESRNARFGGGVAANWGPSAPRRRTSAANWRKPLQWQKEAKRTGIRPRVFCASLADVFDNAVHPDWRSDLFEVIHQTPDLDWLLLTKRIGNVARMMWDDGEMTSLPVNVWLGATIVNQEEADRDILKLLHTPARRRFLSMEPLLGPVDLTSLTVGNDAEMDALRTLTWASQIEDWRGTSDTWEDDFEDWFGQRADEVSGLIHPALDWVIAGGESGPGARPMHPDWARSLRDQCAAAGVPFHFKQWGSCLPGDMDGEDEYGGPAYNIDEDHSEVDYNVLGRGKLVQAHGREFIQFNHKRTGRTLDGVQHDGMPSS